MNHYLPMQFHVATLKLHGLYYPQTGTTTDGTGVVHTAVMYGEDDYNLGMEVGLPAAPTVGMDGAFVEGIHKELDGRYVKECDETIIGAVCPKWQ